MDIYNMPDEAAAEAVTESPGVQVDKVLGHESPVAATEVSPRSEIDKCKLTIGHLPAGSRARSSGLPKHVREPCNSSLQENQPPRRKDSRAKIAQDRSVGVNDKNDSGRHGKVPRVQELETPQSHKAVGVVEDLEHGLRMGQRSLARQQLGLRSTVDS